MQEKTQLAIVIPAYKDTYFEQALLSIANQTNKNFTVYIGDDASPYPLYDVVKKFESSINIVYKKFETNAGGVNLVAQWHRCVNLTKDEKWVWLFSDDDTMEAGCVEAFYSGVKQHPETELFHFDVLIVNEHDAVLSNRPFPQAIGAAELFAGRVKNTLSSFVVEYIFKKEMYQREGGFVEFDLAWGSDDATWYKFLRSNPLITLKGPKVHWRYSGINISSGSANKEALKRKLAANFEYLNWVKANFAQNNIADKTNLKDKLLWITEGIKTAKINLADKIDLARSASKKLGGSISDSLFITAYLILFNIYRRLKR